MDKPAKEKLLSSEATHKADTFRVFGDWRFLEHQTGRHPESPVRLQAIYEGLRKAGVVDGVPKGQVRPAPLDVVLQVHSEELVNRVKRLAEKGGGRIDSDTVVSRASYEVALCAVQITCDAVDYVFRNGGKRALCLLRPPGHHATKDRSMGFCLFNNVAVAAEYARAKHQIERVLIVDWDVHHGNGTQEIFYDNPDVVYFSVHRFPFYPGTGTEREIGTGRGLGATFNLPLRFGVSREEYLQKFRQTLNEAAKRCRPELVLVSAGFDAHAADPIGSLGLETEDFKTLTEEVLEVADRYSQGRLVSVLEGGYNLQALSESVECHVRALS